MPSSDFCLPNDPELSSKHFQLRFVDGKCILEDLQSTNGTFVQERQQTRWELQDEEEFRAGRTVFSVSIMGGQAGSAPTMTLAPGDDRMSGPSVVSDDPTSLGSVPRLSDVSTSPGRPGDSEPHSVATPLVGAAAFILSIRAPDQAEQKLDLPDGISLVIGRTAAATFPIATDPELSSLHLEVSVDGGCCFVRDLSSSNGTFVNETRISRKSISVGDRVRAGRTELFISEPSAPGMALSPVNTAPSQTVTPVIHDIASTPAAALNPLEFSSEQPQVEPSGIGSSSVPPKSPVDAGPKIAAGSDGVHPGRSRDLSETEFQPPSNDTSAAERSVTHPTGGPVSEPAAFTTESSPAESSPTESSPTESSPTESSPAPGSIPNASDASKAASSVNVTPSVDTPPSNAGSGSSEGYVVVRCETNDGQSQVFRLVEGQTKTVGSASSAGQSVEWDAGLEPVHFELIADSGVCILRHCAQSAATFVNGEVSTGQILSDGDKVLAGSTVFTVSIEVD